MLSKQLKHSYFFAFACLVAVSTLISVLTPLQKAEAVAASDWRAGRIIDDAVFYNKDSMSAAQIQDFLNAKVPTCDRWRASSNPSYQPPWTCLKEYLENTTTRENNVGRFNANGTPYQVPGGKSAAQIIWDVAQEYGINPQVLIVMLQKEQGLVTDNWPWAVQYQKAMGYACPDTAPCDTQYYGFYNQVSSAAWQMKRYIAYPNSYNFKAGVTRNILWSPNTACGSSSVFIENAATAALYNYTPYQPNTAALNNMYGSGDSCSAYGNRNFWRYFNDWFGSSRSDDYDYTFAASSRSIVKLDYGQKEVGIIRVQNTGNKIWYGENVSGTKPTRLIINGYAGTEFADLSDNNWLSTAQIRLTEQYVSPGEYATFMYTLKAPRYDILKNFSFNLAVDGLLAMKDKGMYFTYSSEKPKYSVLGGNVLEPKANPGDSVRAIIRLKNVSNGPWFGDINGNTNLNKVRLVNSGYQVIEFSNRDFSAWASPAQIKLQEPVVNPGEIGTFYIDLSFPLRKKSGHIYTLTPTVDGVSDMQGEPISLRIDVPEPVISVSELSINKSGSNYIVRLLNTSNFTWKNENTKSLYPPLRLITSNGYYHPSALYSELNKTGWLSSSQIGMQESAVPVGSIATFIFGSPVNGSSLGESFALALDGYGMPSPTLVKF